MHKKLWNRDFILLLQGNAVSAIGDLMYSVAIGYWVYEQTGSSGLIGIMSSISMFVTMFFSPFCGSIVDKCNRKWVIKVRFWVFSLGFSGAVPLLTAAYLSVAFVPMCILAFLGSFLNCAGNTVFNVCLMLALPQENRSAILGFINSASVGGTALSAVIYGLLGDVFPLYIVFALGNAISLAPMLYMSFHPRTKEFVLEYCE